MKVVCSSNQFPISNNDLNVEQKEFTSNLLNNTNYDFVLFSPSLEQQQQLIHIPKEITNEENNFLINNNWNDNGDYSQSINDQFTPLLQENQQQQLFLFSDLNNEYNNILNDQLNPYNYCYWHSHFYIGENGDCYSYLEALPFCINYGYTYLLI
uniref:Uncharacterized protein n=1 Tax=Meloidogyne hapla TaxID=6305 RepID=A0A1I8BED4_MELHA